MAYQPNRQNLHIFASQLFNTIIDRSENNTELSNKAFFSEKERLGNIVLGFLIK